MSVDFPTVLAGRTAADYNCSSLSWRGGWGNAVSLKADVSSLTDQVNQLNYQVNTLNYDWNQFLYEQLLHFGDDGTNSTSQYHPNDEMIGEIRLIAGDTIPNGWYLCDGRDIPINGNRGDIWNLYSIIYSKFGGDDKTTFKLPDLRSITPRGCHYIICYKYGIYL